MSEGTIIAIDAQQLLRAVCGVAFDRARMSAVYRYIRGVDPTTGEAGVTERQKRLNQLDDAAKACMEPTPWRDYLLRVQHAGFVHQALIASKNAVVNAYSFYIRGRMIAVPKNKLDEIIARWIFWTLLTARYSGSSETAFEQDLARAARLERDDTDGFVRALDDAIARRSRATIGRNLWSQHWRRRSPGLPLRLHFERRRLFSERGRFSRISFCETCSSRPPMALARLANFTIFSRSLALAHRISERRLINQVANLADPVGTRIM